MPSSLRELYSSAAAAAAAASSPSALAALGPSPQRILDLSRYGVRPYDIAGQFLSHPTTAVSKILGKKKRTILVFHYFVCTVKCCQCLGHDF